MTCILTESRISNLGIKHTYIQLLITICIKDKLRDFYLYVTYYIPTYKQFFSIISIGTI